MTVTLRDPQPILDQIDDPVVRKMLVMRWWEQGRITPDEAEALIRANDLVSA